MEERNTASPPGGYNASTTIIVALTTAAEALVNQTTSGPAIEFVWWAEAVIQPTMLSVGGLTNILSIVVLSKVKMNYIFRTCLLALATSDLLTCVTGFAAMVMEVAMFGGEMPFGRWHPRAVATFALYYTYMMFICTSATVVILIALIRNFFIISPMRARGYFTARNTRLVCLIVYLIVFLIFLPTGLNVVYQSCFNETEARICRIAFAKIPNLKQISSRYLFAISALFGPVVIVIYTVCFISIRITVGRSVDALSSMTSKNKDGRRDSARMRGKATSRVTRTLLLILILDVICTLPSVIQAVGLLIAPNATVFDKTDRNYDVFDVIAEIFLNFRPTYNFWLYVFHHPEFRARMRVICFRAVEARPRGYGYEISTSSSLEYKTEVTYVKRRKSDNGMSSIAIVTSFNK